VPRPTNPKPDAKTLAANIAALRRSGMDARQAASIASTLPRAIEPSGPPGAPPDIRARGRAMLATAPAGLDDDDRGGQVPRMPPPGTTRVMARRAPPAKRRTTSWYLPANEPQRASLGRALTGGGMMDWTGLDR